MSHEPRGFTVSGVAASILGRVATPALEQGSFASEPDHDDEPAASGQRAVSRELMSSLAEVKGQAQFLLYLADQIEDSLGQLTTEDDAGHAAFLCKVLGMYSSQLESKHQGLGDRIAETCQEIYVTVREFDVL